MYQVTVKTDMTFKVSPELKAGLQEMARKNGVSQQNLMERYLDDLSDTIYCKLQPELKQSLFEMADELGESASSLMRTAIREGIKQDRERLKK